MIKEKKRTPNLSCGAQGVCSRRAQAPHPAGPRGFLGTPRGRIEKHEIHKNLGEILLSETTEELGPRFEYEIGQVFHAWIRKPDLTKTVAPIYRIEDLCILLMGIRCTY